MPSVLKGFIPWITYLLVSNMTSLGHETAALSALAATTILTHDHLKKGFVLAWGTMIYFGFLAVMFRTPYAAFIDANAFILSNSALATIMWVSIALGKPFSIQYAKEEVAKNVWHTDRFREINYKISLMWATSLTLTALYGFMLVDSIVKEGALTQPIFIALFTIPMWFTRWYPAKRRREFV